MEKIKSSVLDALMDFDSLPEVSAVFVSDGEEVVAAKNGRFAPERIETVAGHIARAFEKSGDENLGADNITFSFANGLVTARSFHDRAILVVLCAHDINLSSLNLLMELVINKLSKEIVKHRASSGSGDSGAGQDLYKGPFGDSLREIGVALCEQIGPAGGIVLSDSVKKWAVSGGPDSTGLSGLIGIIEEELGADGRGEWLLNLRKKFS